MTEPRVVLVTGAASGIGRATAELLAERGHSVVAVDRDGPGLQRVAGGAIVAVECDLATTAGRRLATEAVEGLDVLVQAAAIIRLAPLAEVTPQELHEVLDVNVAAPFLLMQALAPRLRSGGAVVNVASAAAKLGNAAESAVYAASKAALLSLTRTFANALAPRDVRVNAVCPGIVETPMQDQVVTAQARITGRDREEIMRSRLEAVPLRRVASAHECARVIAFLASQESSYMTGQAINVTGGMVTW